ncbi:nudix hydrolase 26, chloroplastic-like isoform X2 [Zingiber officinale]|uniref:nudix hydrolase 26, chloroplastic-like isoform X2 n=1 Tax=Zingiber officinale TaxID=94328 RepID=UPI001C4B5F07|nr:nudix hydrolase 26, chloroplastic-like isoform X2 [Zingiber officinale]
MMVSSLATRPAALVTWPSLNKSLLPINPPTFFKFTLFSTKPSPLVAASMENSPPGYRRNVGICLINPENKIFSASRLDIPGAWQMPQVPYWLTYDFPPEVRAKLNKLWGTDWKGQAQKWFLFRFTGSEDEINLAGDGSEKPEFGEWMWMTPHQVIDHAVDFKKSVYEEVLKFFKSHLQPESSSEA